MYYYDIEHLEELRKYNAIFSNNKKIKIILKLVEKEVNSNSDKEIIIKNILKEYNVPISTIYSWIKQYQKEGVGSLYSETEVINLFLEQSAKPISEWNKRSLCHYLNNNKVIIQGIEFRIAPSETLCWNVLNESMKDLDIEKVVNLNELYQTKDRIGYNIIFMGYIKIPNTKHVFTAYAKYMFIILSSDDIKLKKILIDRTKMDKKDNEIVLGIQKMIAILKKDNVIKRKTFIILSNDEINRKARDIYMSRNTDLGIITYNITKAEGKLKDWFQVLEEIRLEMKRNPEILECESPLNSIIDKYKLIIEDLYD